MKKCNLAWAAGIYEGEGSVCPNGGSRWQIAIISTDEDVVRRFWEIVQRGTVYGPYGGVSSTNKRLRRHKPYWRWACSNRDGILDVARRFGPYLSRRRAARMAEAVAAVRLIEITRRRKRRFD
jgi:hypothetical protein